MGPEPKLINFDSMHNTAFKCSYHCSLLYRPGTQIVGGGCALNTVRVLQWLSGQAGRAAFLGGVGDDQEGRLIQVILGPEKGGNRTLCLVLY